MTSFVVLSSAGTTHNEHKKVSRRGAVHFGAAHDARRNHLPSILLHNRSNTVSLSRERNPSFAIQKSIRTSDPSTSSTTNNMNDSAKAVLFQWETVPETLFQSNATTAGDFNNTNNHTLLDNNNSSSDYINDDTTFTSSRSDASVIISGILFAIVIILTCWLCYMLLPLLIGWVKSKIPVSPTYINNRYHTVEYWLITKVRNVSHVCVCLRVCACVCWLDRFVAGTTILNSHTSHRLFLLCGNALTACQSTLSSL